MSQTDELFKLPVADTTVDQIMEVFEEASEVHKQALIAMGQLPDTTITPVASTEMVMKLTPDFSSRAERG